METLRQSYLYAIAMGFAAWIGRQWDASILVKWLTTQDLHSYTTSAFGRFADTVRGIYCSVFEKLKLPKLLEGSIFLHPMLFAAAAMVLAPLCPTIVVLGLVCASFFSLFLKLGVDRQCGLTKTPLNVYICLYAFIYGYSTLTSTTLSGSLFTGLLTILFVLFFFVVAQTTMSEDRIRNVMWLLMGAGAAVSAYGFYQFLNPELYSNVWTDTDMFSTISFRVYSTLENPNVLGEYFLLVIPLGCAILLTTDTWPKRIAALVITAMMGLCLILTYSRGCYLGLLFAAAVFLVLLDKRFLVAGIIAIALCPLYLPESVLSRFTSIGNMGDTSTSYRVSIWLGTLSMLKDYWFCGIGPGINAYNMVYPEYAFNTITAPHAHNLYLQIMCDTGICGIAVFLITMVAFYRMMFTAIRYEQDKRIRVFQIACTASITGFLVQSMTDYTFYNYRVMLLFWVIMGLSAVFARMGRKEAAK